MSMSRVSEGTPPPGEITTILRRWRHHTGPVREWQRLSDKGTVLAVTAESGAQYVLKEVVKGQPIDHRLERLVSEQRLLLYLASRGVPVPAPLDSDGGMTTFVRHPEGGDTVYTLHPLLPNRGMRGLDGTRVGSSPLPGWEQPAVWTNVGAAIGRLHRALADYPGEIVSWHMALPKQIREHSLPAARARLFGDQRASLDEAVDGLMDAVCAALADLPEQHIHGDCHGGNILITAGDVSGFVDLDHLPLAPRMYDLFYLMADRVKERIYEPERLVRLPSLLPDLITGYEREIAISPRERAALWPGMLATELLFVQSAATKLNVENLDRHLRTLTWVRQHREEIERTLAAA
jgi:Ser/Thr protein kinase RdoA (MazF antagonist)